MLCADAMTQQFRMSLGLNLQRFGSQGSQLGAAPFDTKKQGCHAIRPAHRAFCRDCQQLSCRKACCWPCCCVPHDEAHQVVRSLWQCSLQGLETTNPADIAHHSRSHGRCDCRRSEGQPQRGASNAGDTTCTLMVQRSSAPAARKRVWVEGTLRCRT